MTARNRQNNTDPIRMNVMIWADGFPNLIPTMMLTDNDGGIGAGCRGGGMARAQRSLPLFQCAHQPRDICVEKKTATQNSKGVDTPPQN